MKTAYYHISLQQTSEKSHRGGWYFVSQYVGHRWFFLLVLEEIISFVKYWTKRNTCIYIVQKHFFNTLNLWCDAMLAVRHTAAELKREDKFLSQIARSYWQAGRMARSTSVPRFLSHMWLNSSNLKCLCDVTSLFSESFCSECTRLC